MAACGGIRALPVTRPGTGSFVAERDAAPLELCASRPQASPAADGRAALMTILTRRASRADAALISILNADVQTIHADALPGLFKPPSPGSFTAEADALLANSDNLLFLAFFDHEPAGYAYAQVIRRQATTLTYAAETVYLHHISVLSKYRRRGVGSALLNAVQASGVELGITLLMLDVWTFNEGARAFFWRHGFQQDVERLWRGQAFGALA